MDNPNPMTVLVPEKGRQGETEKITINLGVVDLGQIDLLVQQAFYTNRSDFIRHAIRQQLRQHELELRDAMARKSLVLGLRVYTRADLEAARDSGRPLAIQVLGLASVAADVDPALARAAIASVEVLGVFQAAPAIKAALADRLR